MLQMPLIGLGTYQLQGKDCETIVRAALDMGYRHVDTADVYENHREVGKGIRAFPRDELYLVSKIWMNSLTPELVHKAIPRFLEELQTDYLDLVLIHWPAHGVDFEETLSAMHSFKETGEVRAVGVSNFVRSQLQAMKTRHAPVAVNQVELHPYLQRRSLVNACREWGIGVTAYRPLAKGALSKDPVLTQVGSNYGKTASQVALRWIVQQGIPVIPKAAHLHHLKENFEIFDFELSKKEMEQIFALDRGQRFCAPEDMPLFEDD